MTPRLIPRLRALFTLRRSRARLAALDDHILRDIGLDRPAALSEARRRIWDVPPNWRG